MLPKKAKLVRSGTATAKKRGEGGCPEIGWSRARDAIQTLNQSREARTRTPRRYSDHGHAIIEQTHRDSSLLRRFLRFLVMEIAPGGMLRLNPHNTRLHDFEPVVKKSPVKWENEQCIMIFLFYLNRSLSTPSSGRYFACALRLVPA